MIFQAGWFSQIFLAASWLLLAALLAMSAKSAVAAAKQHRSAFILAMLILAASWNLNASPDSGQLAGLSYHLLALNLSALMTGIAATFWLGALLMFPYLLFHGAAWQVYPANALALLLIPLAVNFTARRIVNRLPANLFIFIFVNGFIASAVGILLTGLLLTVIFRLTGAFSANLLWSTVFPVFILIAWAEAFLSGISTAIFIALRPQWIHTFDDNRYLKRRNSIW